MSGRKKAPKEKEYTQEQIDRKIRKLARALAESNTWIDTDHKRTLKPLSNAWSPAYDLVRALGFDNEYTKHSKKIERKHKK